jgi:riboflavin synthase
MGDEMAGHIVAGHVDGVFKNCFSRGRKRQHSLSFRNSADYAFYLAPKSSIALDGISLTVNEVEGQVFGVNIIPHTQKETTIGEKQAGDLMNFEIDLIARYVGNMLKARGLA